MDDSTALIPAEPLDLTPEPAKPTTEPAEVVLGRGRHGRRHKKHAKAGDDPLDRFVARRRAQSILALKIEGRKPREIAAELNIPIKSVYWALYQLRRGGHIEAKTEVAEALTNRIMPLIAERLEERLEDPACSEDLLVKAAQGTGMFINHAKVKNEGAPVQQALIVKFEMPQGALPTTAVGEIHGASIVEGEVVR